MQMKCPRIPILLFGCFSDFPGSRWCYYCSSTPAGPTRAGVRLTPTPSLFFIMGTTPKTHSGWDFLNARRPRLFLRYIVRKLSHTCRRDSCQGSWQRIYSSLYRCWRFPHWFLIRYLASAYTRACSYHHGLERGRYRALKPGNGTTYSPSCLCRERLPCGWFTKHTSRTPDEVGH